MDDYPNSSEAWQVEKPEERKEAEAKEQAKVSSSAGVIQEVVDWFDAQAKAYDSIDSIMGVSISSKATDVKQAVIIAQKMRAEFQSKSHSFRSQFSQHLKEEKD